MNKLVKIGTVYGIYNSSNNLLVYIGQTSNFEQRKQYHYYKYKRYMKVLNDNSTYAKMVILIPNIEHFDMKPINTYIDIMTNDLVKHEREYILKYGPICNNSTASGYKLNAKLYSITHKDTNQLLYVDTYYNGSLDITFKYLKQIIEGHNRGNKSYSLLYNIGTNNFKINHVQDISEIIDMNIKKILYEYIDTHKPIVRGDEVWDKTEINYPNKQINIIYKFTIKYFDDYGQIFNTFDKLLYFSTYCIENRLAIGDKSYNHLDSFTDIDNLKLFLESRSTFENSCKYITGIYLFIEKFKLEHPFITDDIFKQIQDIYYSYINKSTKNKRRGSGEPRSPL